MSHTSDESGGLQRPQRGLNRHVKLLLIFLAVLIGFFEHALGGWGGPVTMASAAMLVPILLYRRLWNEVRFWIAAALLAAIQVPVVIAVRPVIEHARSFYLLMFVMLDGLFMIVAISFACPDSGAGGLRPPSG